MSTMSRRRESFAVQMGAQQQRRFSQQRVQRRGSTYAERVDLAQHVGTVTDEVTAPFQSTIAPTDMRQLALVAHNHMKPAMKQFIETYSEILKKFRITGTQTTMKMCKSMWGEDDPSIHYGLTCTSGPLGGDAQIAALMCMEDLGGIIFFVDPLSAHPHQADIDSLLRLANCGNVIVCANPASASSMMHTLRAALLKGDRARGMIPSFFETLESPAVEEYKHQQAVALANVIKGNSPSGAPVAETPTSSEEINEETEVEGYEDTYAEPPLSETEVDRVLMGNTLAFDDARLQALLAVDSDDETETEDEEEEEEGLTPVAAPTGKVSKGIFGIRVATKTKKSTGRNKVKLLSKSVKKMMLK